MPTVLRIGRFRFFFFSNEGQEPSHIHVKVRGRRGEVLAGANCISSQLWF